MVRMLATLLVAGDMWICVWKRERVIWWARQHLLIKALLSVQSQQQSPIEGRWMVGWQWKVHCHWWHYQSSSSSSTLWRLSLSREIVSQSLGKRAGFTVRLVYSCASKPDPSRSWAACLPLFSLLGDWFTKLHRWQLWLSAIKWIYDTSKWKMIYIQWSLNNAKNAHT